MKTKLFSTVLLGSVFLLGVPSIVAQDQSGNSGFKQDMSNAGHDTSNAARDTGHGIQNGTEKGWHKTKHGTKKAWHKTKNGTEDVTHSAAHKTDEGAQHVEQNTQPQ